MKIAVSSMAWSDEEQAEALLLLKDLGLNTIEIVPGRLMGKQEDLEAIKKNGFEICCFQGLLFNTKDLFLFSTKEAKDNLMAHLILLDKYATEVGAKSYVFGSPKNRWIPDDMAYEEAEDQAIQFLRNLGDKIDNTFCLEAVDVSYGCNFLKNTDELGQFIRKVNHPKIKMNFDLGAVIANGEDLKYLVDNYQSLFGHIHVSEIQLRVPGMDDNCLDYHKQYSELIRKYSINNNLVSIEMLRDKSLSLREQLEKAVNFTKQIYDC